MLDNTVTKSEALWFAKRDALRNANRTKPCSVQQEWTPIRITKFIESDIFDNEYVNFEWRRPMIGSSYMKNYRWSQYHSTTRRKADV